MGQRPSDVRSSVAPTCGYGMESCESCHKDCVGPGGLGEDDIHLAGRPFANPDREAQQKRRSTVSEQDRRRTLDLDTLLQEAVERHEKERREILRRWPKQMVPYREESVSYRASSAGTHHSVSPRSKSRESTGPWRELSERSPRSYSTGAASAGGREFSHGPIESALVRERTLQVHSPGPFAEAAPVRRETTDQSRRSGSSGERGAGAAHGLRLDVAFRGISRGMTDQSRRSGSSGEEAGFVVTRESTWRSLHSRSPTSRSPRPAAGSGLVSRESTAGSPGRPRSPREHAHSGAVSRESTAGARSPRPPPREHSYTGLSRESTVGGRGGSKPASRSNSRSRENTARESTLQSRDRTAPEPLADFNSIYEEDAKTGEKRISRAPDADNDEASSSVRMNRPRSSTTHSHFVVNGKGRRQRLSMSTGGVIVLSRDIFGRDTTLTHEEKEQHEAEEQRQRALNTLMHGGGSLDVAHVTHLPFVGAAGKAQLTALNLAVQGTGVAWMAPVRKGKFEADFKWGESDNLFNSIGVAHYSGDFQPHPLFSAQGLGHMSIKGTGIQATGDVFKAGCRQPDAAPVAKLENFTGGVVKLTINCDKKFVRLDQLGSAGVQFNDVALPVVPVVYINNCVVTIISNTQT